MIKTESWWMQWNNKILFLTLTEKKLDMQLNIIWSKIILKILLIENIQSDYNRNDVSLTENYEEITNIENKYENIKNKPNSKFKIIIFILALLILFMLYKKY